MLKKLRFRFRLRTLLLLFVVVAVFCWWKNEPRRLAAEFVKHVNAGEHGKAEAMIVDAPANVHEFPFVCFVPGQAQLSELKWQDWWQGRARIVVYKNKEHPDIDWTQSFLVTRRGVHQEFGGPLLLNTYEESPDRYSGATKFYPPQDLPPSDQSCPNDPISPFTNSPQTR